MLTPWKESYDQSRQHIKKQRHYFANKGPSSQGFPFIFRFHALEKEMATHSSILVWRIPWTEEPGVLQSIGLQRVGHDWIDLTRVHTCCNMYQSIILLSCGIIFYCMKISHLFIHSLVDGHLGHFHFLVVTNTTINIHIQVFVWMCFQFCWVYS